MSINSDPTNPFPLQLWLAKQLKEELNIWDKFKDFAPADIPLLTERYIIEWDENDFERAKPVTPREWDYIVRRVEEKLYGNAGLWTRYCGLIHDASDKKVFHSDYRLPWPTRAVALMKVKGESV